MVFTKFRNKNGPRIEKGSNHVLYVLPWKITVSVPVTARAGTVKRKRKGEGKCLTCQWHQWQIFLFPSVRGSLPFLRVAAQLLEQSQAISQSLCSPFPVTHPTTILHLSCFGSHTKGWTGKPTSTTTTCHYVGFPFFPQLLSC